MRDPQGRQVTLTYTGGQLTQVADADNPNRTLTLTYDTGSRIQTVSDGARTVTYGYTAQGDLGTVQDVMQRTTTYTYQSHLLTQITDPLGQVVEEQQYDVYTPQSKAIRQTLQDGRRLDLAYLADTTIITTTGLDGRTDVEQIGYAPANTLTGRTVNGEDVLGAGFDGSFSPARVTDGSGNTTNTVYTANGQPTEQTDALGQTTRMEYDSRNNLTAMTDAQGVTTRWRYDSFNNVISTTIGITTTANVALTTLSRYQYQAPDGTWGTTEAGALDSRLYEQQAPDGVITRYAYDATYSHRVTQVTLGPGTAAEQRMTYGYDSLGRLQDTTRGAGTPLARTDRTVYNADNTVQQTIQNDTDGVFDLAKPDEDLVTSYGYDGAGQQIWTRDVYGRYDVTHYNAHGQVDWTARNFTASGWNGGSTLPDAPSAYSPAAPDQNVATLYGYDGLGRTAFVTETGILTGTFTTATLQWSAATERVTRTEYDTLSRPVTVTLNYRPGLPSSADTNVQTITQYDGAGNVTWQRDALARWTTTDYDARNRPITVTVNYQDGDPLTGPGDADLVSVTRYDSLGRVDRTIDNAVDGVFTATEPITDRVTLFQYDALGRTRATIQNHDPAQTTRTDTNRQTETAYDPATGRVLGTRDALGRWTSQQYDALGRVHAIIHNCRDASGTPVATGCGTQTNERNVKTQTGYDALGRTTLVTDALNIVTRTLYDRLGRATQTVQNYIAGGPSDQATNVTITTRYDALGRTTATSDATDATSYQAVNPLGQTTLITDALGRVTRQGYDGSGTLRWTRRSDGQLTLLQVDGLGRVVATIQNYEDGLVSTDEPTDRDLITRTSYDAAGRRVQSVDAANRITQFAYDNLDRLTGVTENVLTSGCTPERTDCNVVTQYQYDRAGNRTAIIDANQHTRQFSYNAADQLIEERDALNRLTSYQYDAGGRQTFKADPRGQANDLTFGYDERDRLIVTTADNLDDGISTMYDALGRRTSMSDGSGTTSFGYDPLGRITSVQAPGTGTLAYGYNARSQRTRLTYPGTGAPVIQYTYLRDGRMDLVTQGTTTLADYGYDPLGRLQSVARANGATTSYGYDHADRLTDLHTATGGTTLSRFAYQVDRLGLRRVVSEMLTLDTLPAPAGLVAAYSFDDGSGTTLHDGSGLGNHGSITGATWTSAGKYGSALIFDSSSQVTIPDAPSLDLSDGMTLEAWVYLSMHDYDQPLIRKAQDQALVSVYQLAADSDLYETPEGGIRVGGTWHAARCDDLTSNCWIGEAGSWTHLAQTYDGSHLTLYVNGLAVTTSPVSGPIDTSSSPLYLGRLLADGAAATFQGGMDEVRIYNRALTQSEIQQDMARPLGPPPASPTPTPTASPTPTSTATSTGVAVTATPSAPATQTATPQPATTMRLNAGGPAVSTSGVSWEADQYFSGGSTYSKNVAIAGTSDDVLYQTERYAPSLSYAIPVPNDTYSVRLHFAELYFTASGRRVFSVNLEGGALELANYDIYAEVGANTAVVKSFAVTVSDGTLNVELSASVNNAKLSAIEIVPASSPTATPTSTPTPTPQPPTPDPGTRLRSVTLEHSSLTDATTGFSSTSGTVERSTSSPLKGSASFHVPNTTSGYGTISFATTDALFVSMYVRWEAAASDNPRLLRVVNDNAGTSVTAGNLDLDSNRRLRLRNGTTTLGTSAPLTAGTVYRVGLHQQRGTGSDGVLEAYLAVGDALFGAPFASSHSQSITTPIKRIEVGATNGVQLDATFDDIAVDTGSLPGPSAAGRSPALARVVATPQPVVAEVQVPLSRMQAWGAPLHQTSVETRTLIYGYDDLNRLTSAVESGATTSYNYSYDRVGNRTDGGRQYDAANQVIGWQYDAAGNLLSDGTSTYTYDALNRVVTTDGITNSYNGAGVLVQQGSTRYVQDLQAPLSQILSDGISTSVYGQERLFALTGSSRTWYATDALGSVRQSMNDSGVVLGSLAFDPWGQVQQGSAPTFGFTGELQQGSNVYLRARWYNALNGTFTSRDSFAGWATRPYSQHPYQYAYANPALLTDPSGQCVGYLWGDPSCQFIGWNNVKHGNFNWDDGKAWFGTAADLAPGIGDVKGLAEVFTDCDIVTGERLGAWRYMGLLPLLGPRLRALRQARHLGDLEAISRHLDELTRLLGDLRLAPRASGHSIDLQLAIMQALQEGEYVAFRSRALGAEQFDFGPRRLLAKPEGAKNLSQFHILPALANESRRVVEVEKAIMVAVSDMDPAWFVRNGQIMSNRKFVDDILPEINRIYGTDVVQHGPHVNGVLENRGAPLENLSDIVYVYGADGYLGEGAMLDTLQSLAPSSTQEVAQLWQQLITYLGK